MTEKDTTDNTEKPSRDELEHRVEQLEQTVQQMLPSRRDALKLGGTALAAGALGSAATGSASAGTNSVGTIGSASSPVDAELEDVNPGSVRAVNLNNNEITNVSSLSTARASITNTTGKASLTTAQTVSTSTVTQLTLNQKEIEESSAVDVDLTNNQLVTQAGGRYLVVASIDFAGSSTFSSGDRLVTRIHINGTNEQVREVQHEGVNGAITVTCIAPFDLASNDTIDMRAFHDRGGDETVSGSPTRTFLSATKVG